MINNNIILHFFFRPKKRCFAICIFHHMYVICMVELFTIIFYLYLFILVGHQHRGQPIKLEDRDLKFKSHTVL